jgi:hypothetical protein
MGKGVGDQWRAAPPRSMTTARRTAINAEPHYRLAPVLATHIRVKDLIHTNNPALISYVESLLKSADIGYFIADQSISAAEGSIGMFPKRILVDPDRFRAARALMIEAGLEHELRPLGK